MRGNVTSMNFFASSLILRIECIIVIFILCVKYLYVPNVLPPNDHFFLFFQNTICHIYIFFERFPLYYACINYKKRKIARKRLISNTDHHVNTVKIQNFNHKYSVIILKTTSVLEGHGCTEIFNFLGQNSPTT